MYHGCTRAEYLPPSSTQIFAPPHRHTLRSLCPTCSHHPPPPQFPAHHVSLPCNERAVCCVLIPFLQPDGLPITAGEGISFLCRHHALWPTPGGTRTGPWSEDAQLARGPLRGGLCVKGRRRSLRREPGASLLPGPTPACAILTQPPKLCTLPLQAGRGGSGCAYVRVGGWVGREGGPRLCAWLSGSAERGRHFSTRDSARERARRVEKPAGLDFSTTDSSTREKAPLAVGSRNNSC